MSDALRTKRSSGKEKDTFIWFDEVDKILGMKPVVDPVEVVENDECKPMPASPTTSSDLTHTSDPDIDDGESFPLLVAQGPPILLYSI